MPRTRSTASVIAGASSASFPITPPVIPDHELIRVIGSGSYGTVWLARNIMGSYRAVKVVYRQTFDDDRPYEREFRGIQRFEPISRAQESQVQILHIGRNLPGAYFFYVMELADAASGDRLAVIGEPGAPTPTPKPIGTLSPLASSSVLPENYAPRTLKSDLARAPLGRLPVSDCVEIALALTKGLQHLHSHGLVHRDVKPSNIIFINGTPKLADIGLVTGVDATMSQVGTEGFVAPEGAGTPQSDIYSLGKVLYEISTGKDRQAFPEPMTEIGSCPDRERLLELDEIVSRACAHDPKKRYPSAQAMQEDVLLLRAGQSVKRLHRIQRQLALVTRAAVIVLCLLVVLGAGWLYAVHKERQASLARLEAERSRQSEVLARRGAESAQHEAQHAVDTLSRMQLLRAEEFLNENRSLDALAYLAHVVRLTPSNRIASARLTHLLMGRAWAVPALPMLQHGARVTFATFSPDGRYIGTSCADGKAYVWDAYTGNRIGAPMVHQAEINEICFSPDGNHVVTVSQDQTARIWQSASGAPVGEVLRHNAGVGTAKFSPDGKQVATACDDGKAIVWDVGSFRAILTIEAHEAPIEHIEFDSGGNKLGTGSQDHTACVWDTGSGRLISRLQHPDEVKMVRFSPDGKQIITGCKDGSGRIWDTISGKETTPSLKHSANVRHVDFSPDGQRVVTASRDGTAVIWDAASGKALGQPMRHADWVRAAGFSRDGLRIITGSMDGTMRVWDGKTGEPLIEPVPLGANVFCAEFHPDGRHVLTASISSEVQVWDVSFGAADGIRLKHGEKIRRVITSADSSVLASTAHGIGRSVGLWRLGSLESLHDWDLDLPTVHHLEFRPGSHQLLVGGDWRYAQLMDLDPPYKRSSIGLHDGPIRKARFSEDGRLVVTCSDDHSARVWSAQDEKPLTDPLVHPRTIHDVRFSPDGRWVLTACRDGAARLWEAKGGRLAFPPLHHQGAVNAIRFGRDGRFFATASDDKTVRFWDTLTGSPLGSALTIPGEVDNLWLNPADDDLVLVQYGNSSRLWSRRSAEPLSPRFLPVPHAENVFSPDGARMLTMDTRGALVVRGVPTSEVIFEVLPRDGEFTSACFSSNGEQVIAGDDHGGIRIWDVSDSFANVDSLLPEVAEAIARRKIDEQGRLVSLPTRVLWALAARVGGDGSVGALRQVRDDRNAINSVQGRPTGSRSHLISPFVHWFFAERNHRPISPASALSASQMVSKLIARGGIGALHEALLRDPTNGTAIQAYSLELSAQSKGDSRLVAEAKFLRQITSNGFIDSWETCWRRSAAAALTGDFAEAVAANSKAVSLWLENPTLLAHQAVLLELAGRSEEAGAAHQLAWEEIGRHPLIWDSRHPGLLGAASANFDAEPLAESNGRWALRSIGAGPGLKLPFRGQVIGDYFSHWEIHLTGTNPSTLRLRWNLETGNLLLPYSVSGQFRPDSVGGRVCAFDLANHPGWKNRRIHSAELLFSPEGTNQSSSFLIDRISLGREGERNRPFAEVCGGLVIEQWRQLLDVNPLLFGKLRGGRVPVHGETPLTPRSSEAPRRLIDLSQHYNASIRRFWNMYRDYDANFRNLGQGEVRLGGTWFDIRGVVQLSSTEQRRYVPGYPERVEGIEVGCTAQRLEFLQATAWNDESKIHVGTYVVHYVDGGTETIPLIYGEHLRDFSGGGDPQREVPAALLVASEYTSHGKELRLFKMSWVNPHPTIAIQSLDFISTMTAVAPFLVAVTAEQ